MTATEYVLARYYDRKSKGICVDCGKKAEEGVTRCGACREFSASNQRARYRLKKEKGICIRCANPAFGGTTMCEKCLENNRANRKAFYARRA